MPASPEPEVRAPLWRALALVAVLALTVAVYALPTRGLTFLWDEWVFLAHIRTEPWPARWFEPHMGHLLPLPLALFDLEHALFGSAAWGFLLVGCAIHLANVGLLERLAFRAWRDERTSAVVAAAFGLSTVYREVLWWSACTGILLATTGALVGLLALERAREGRPRAILVAALAALLAPFAHGVGLSVGPALALGALGLLPRERRARGAAWILAGWGLYVALYLARGVASGARVPTSAGELATAGVAFAHGIGIGLVREGFLVPAPVTARSAVQLTVAYATIVLALGAFLGREDRARVAAGHALLVLSLGSVVAARWWWWQPVALAVSRYQYLGALAWTIGLGAGLGLARRRWPRGALPLAAVAVALMALAQIHAASTDTRLVAPGARASTATFARRLVAAARRAEGPLFDAPLPVSLPGHASDLVAALSPETSVVWTSTRTIPTVTPYLVDPWLRPLAAAHETESHGPEIPR